MSFKLKLKSFTRAVPLFFFVLFMFNSSLYAMTIKTYEIKFHNVSVKNLEPKDLNLKWKFFLLDNDKILFNQPTDKYRHDQHCTYSFDIDENGRVIESSIKLIEHKANSAFNLKAFEFLKDFDVELKAAKEKKLKNFKDTGLSPRVDFNYLAF